jgi:hypothetical protein
MSAQKNEPTPLEIEADSKVRADELYDSSTESDDENNRILNDNVPNRRPGESVQDFLERQT